jgi:catechol 2,3-dioxygenase-like lactoylglutathione lyase family enzyme
MLSDNPVFPSIRVSDIKKAREFYESKLGLKVVYDEPDGVLIMAGKNSRIFIYEGEKSKATHTLAVFYVDDMEKKVSELAERGVIFEKYDLPEIKTDDRGIATLGGKKAAWFRDPDGNVLGLSQIK